MNTINENNQQDGDVQAFLPHQLEQDYLSCLLGTDDVDVQETESETLDGEAAQTEQAVAQSDEEKEPLNDPHDCSEIAGEKEKASERLLENNTVDANENLIQSISESSADNKEINTDIEVSNNKRDEQYLSIEELSISAPFVCQLMLIAGVKFAVPLANFSRVIAVPKNVEVNSNVASACLGKFEWQDKPMFLLALKQIMQPFNTAKNGCLNESDKIVLVEKDNFGFVCNQMLETVTISPEDVLWRDEFSQRYWLAGMVKEAGFAILDVKGILRSATGR